MNYLDQAGIGSDSWQMGFAIEGKSDVTIGIWIHISYVRNYVSVVRPMFRHILGCCCLFGGPAASHVVCVMFSIVSCSTGYNT
eukprot:13860362-Ditylum_brightwellii.AAC.1